MNMAEIRDLKLEELEEELDDAREELMRMRFQLTTGELTDYNRLSTTRKKIARFLTELGARQKSVESEGEK